MQTKKGSLFETCCNVFSGLVTAFFTWKLVVMPIAQSNHWDMNQLVLYQILVINVCFTVVSIIRGYFWRRLFNWLDFKGIVK